MPNINMYKITFLFIFLMLFSFNVFSQPTVSQCLLQNEFKSVIKIEGDKFIVSLKRKDDKPFKYYSKLNIFTGFKFSDNRKIDSTNLNLGMLLIASKNKKFNDGFNYFKSEDNRLISYLFSSSRKVSQLERLPSTDDEFELVLEYRNEIKINEFIESFSRLMSNNEIEGMHKIKFYVKLPLDMSLNCIYLESNEIDYYFKPNYIFKPLKSLKTIRSGLYE